MSRDYCCDAMRRQFEVESDEDRFVYYSNQFDEHGLVDRVDPSAYSPIAYCPWCGKKILSKRYSDLERLEKRRHKDGPISPGPSISASSDS